MSDALRKLATKWRWESENLLHGTRPGEDGPMCAQKKSCADELDAALGPDLPVCPDRLAKVERTLEGIESLLRTL